MTRDPATEQVIRALHVLVGKMHLFEAGTGILTNEEWNLIYDLTDWYEKTGRALLAERAQDELQAAYEDVPGGRQLDTRPFEPLEKRT